MFANVLRKDAKGRQPTPQEKLVPSLTIRIQMPYLDTRMGIHKEDAFRARQQTKKFLEVLKAHAA